MSATARVRQLCVAPVGASSVCGRTTYTVVDGDPLCPEHRDDARRPPEFCSVASGLCENPPGIGTGGGVYTCTDRRTTARCIACDEACCSSCRFGRRGNWICHNCAEQGYRVPDRRS